MFFYLFHFEIIITHAPNPPIYSFLFSFSSIISFSLIAAKVKTVSTRENKAGIRNLAIALHFCIQCALQFSILTM